MKILVLGASCIDIMGYSDRRIISYASNQGAVKILKSGSARNAAQYLSLMGLPSKLVTAVGDDNFGQDILISLAKTGIDISSCLILKNASTTINLSLIDAGGELYSSVKSDNLSFMLDIRYIKNTIVYRPDILLADDTLNVESLVYTADNICAKIKIFQPVSVNIGSGVLDILNKFDIVKLNKTQAETICGRLISSVEDAKRCAEYIVNVKGVKKVFILLDEQGSVCTDASQSLHVHAYKTERSNKAEAEAAYSAGIIFSLANSFSLYKTALFTQVCYSYSNNLPIGEREKFSLEDIWSMLLTGEKIIAQDQEY